MRTLYHTIDHAPMETTIIKWTVTQIDMLTITDVAHHRVVAVGRQVENLVVATVTGNPPHATTAIIL